MTPTIHQPPRRRLEFPALWLPGQAQRRLLLMPAGVVNHRRGMGRGNPIFVSDTFTPPANFVNDTLTDTNAVLLENHTGETGATWAKHPANIDNAQIQGNRACNKNAAGADSLYYASGVPASADYEVEGDCFVQTNLAGADWWLVARIDTVANTCYRVRYSKDNGYWQLFKVVTGSFTSLGTFVQALSTSTAYHALLLVKGNTQRFFVDGVERITAADTAVTGTGRPGCAFFGAATLTTNYHLDNFKAHPSLLLVDHVGETGATWTLETGGDARLFGGRVHSATAAGIISASGTPASADYDVTIDGVCVTATGNMPRVAGRIKTGGDDCYFVDYSAATTNFTLQKRLATVETTLATYTDAGFTAGVTRSIMLRMRGSAISLLVDGVLRAGPITDTGVTAAGKAGLYFVNAIGELTGFRADNFVATNA